MSDLCSLIWYTLIGLFRSRAALEAEILVVPATNPEQLTDTGESVDSSIDERSLRIDLAHRDEAIPIACCVGSRNPCASASAQRSAAQLPEAPGPQPQRPAVACRPLSPGSWGAGRSEDHKAGDA